MENEEIIFAAKKNDWISIRKLFIDEKTVTPEAVGVLMGIRQSIDRKIFTFAGVDTDKVGEIAESLVKGKKKSYEVVAELLALPKPTAELRTACSSEAALPAAEAYLNKTMLELIGFFTEIETDVFNKTYPENKIAKPRGNFGKKKKK